MMSERSGDSVSGHVPVDNAAIICLNAPCRFATTLDREAREARRRSNGLSEL